MKVKGNIYYLQKQSWSAMNEERIEPFTAGKQQISQVS